MQNSSLNVMVRSSSQASHYLKIWQNDERVLSVEDGDLATQDSIIILLRLLSSPSVNPLKGPPVEYRRSGYEPNLNHPLSSWMSRLAFHDGLSDVSVNRRLLRDENLFIALIHPVPVS